MRLNVTTGLRRQAVRMSMALAISLLPVSTDIALAGAAGSPPLATPEAAGTLVDARFVAEAVHRFGLPEAWIWAIIRAESHGDPNAVSPAGAMGLMQIMPATWRFERARLGLGEDPFKPRDNILAGADYLAIMRQRYGVVGMLAAYNAGPGRYEDFHRRGRPLPIETLSYVRRLAPVVTDGATVDGVAPAFPDPLAWMHAALFAARANSAAARSPAPVDETPVAALADDGTTPSAAGPKPRDNGPIAVDPRASGLFVSLTGDPS